MEATTGGLHAAELESVSRCWEAFSTVSDKEATVIRMQYLSWGQSDRLHLSGSFPQVWERFEREVGNGQKPDVPIPSLAYSVNKAPPPEAFADIWVSISKYKNEMKRFLDFHSKSEVSKQAQGKQTRSRRRAQHRGKLSHHWKP